MRWAEALGWCAGLRRWAEALGWCAGLTRWADTLGWRAGLTQLSLRIFLKDLTWGNFHKGFLEGIAIWEFPLGFSLRIFPYRFFLKDFPETKQSEEEKKRKSEKQKNEISSRSAAKRSAAQPSTVQRRSSPRYRVFCCFCVSFIVLCLFFSEGRIFQNTL